MTPPVVSVAERVRQLLEVAPPLTAEQIRQLAATVAGARRTLRPACERAA